MREELLKIGFKEIPHFTIGNSLIYDLGRNRELSISCLSTPNEMVFICEKDNKDENKINDIICLRNFDYDGYTSLEDIKNIINSINPKLLLKN